MPSCCVPAERESRSLGKVIWLFLEGAVDARGSRRPLLRHSCWYSDGLKKICDLQNVICTRTRPNRIANLTSQVRVEECHVGSPQPWLRGDGITIVVLSILRFKNDTRPGTTPERQIK